MPWEGIRFDAKGDNELGSAIIVQVQDGEYRTVYPPSYEAVEAIYPMPDRTDRP
jgi:branched-chain amino acid transport system substrate-binding protein